MKTNNANTVPSEKELSALQSQIRQIIDVCESLRGENVNLRKQTLTLMAEKKGLIKVNESARERLQIIIGRLREIERTRPGSKTRSG
ncbi:MAG: hypothetical protein K0U66_02840 [Gammaproteobacteria bacterium]|nr:hypothetical protein [Pseudomonadota bacterium]MCH9662580.1 hypothetical protein [Gammaproteobacteria bacterium]